MRTLAQFIFEIIPRAMYYLGGGKPKILRRNLR